jgi:murein DD-endopeptidase MepM/ murein hydrolase activator NlpD
LTVENRRPRTRIIPVDEVGGEGGSRLIEQQRRLANPYPLAPKEYQAITHNRIETSPPLTTLEGNAPAFLIGQPPLFLPETETVDALGGGYAPLRREEVEQTVLDLALRPHVDTPLVPNPDALYPEGESLLTPEEEATFVDASGEEEGGYVPLRQEEEEPIVVEGVIEEGVSPELPLEEAPPTIETSQSLATGLAAEEPTISPRALTRQTTEELAAAIEDIDTAELAAATAKQRAVDEEERRIKEEEKFQKTLAKIAKIEDQQLREERQAAVAAEREAKRAETERLKAEKESRKRVAKPTTSQLQIPGVKRSDVANTPKLTTFFRPQAEELQYARLAAANRSVPASQLATAEEDTFKVEKLGSITLSQEEEEPQRITFTQPSAATFKFAEGGGV